MAFVFFVGGGFAGCFLLWQVIYSTLFSAGAGHDVLYPSAVVLSPCTFFNSIHYFPGGDGPYTPGQDRKRTESATVVGRTEIPPSADKPALSVQYDDQYGVPGKTELAFAGALAHQAFGPAALFPL